MLTLDQSLELAISFAKLVMEKKGSIRPMFIGETADRGVFQYMPETFNEETKQEIAISVRLLWLAYNVVQSSFISEAWLRKIGAKDIEKERAKPDFKRISNHPDRIEVVSIMCENGLDIMGASLRIIRDKKGNFKELGEPDKTAGRIGEKMAPGGTFTGLISPPDVTISEADRECARGIIEAMGLEVQSLDNIQ